MMQWLFDGNFDTVPSGYNGYLLNGNTNISTNSSSLWVSPGYTGYGSAVYLPANVPYVVNQYFALSTTSFTISAWVWSPFNFTGSAFRYFGLFSHCSSTSNDNCLHVVIGNGYLRLGFFSDDLVGSTLIKINQWYHVAYVYDRSASKQYVYLSGYLDGSRVPASAYLGNKSQFVIGSVPLLTNVIFQSGYIDKLTYVSRAKTATEILDEATLVAYYPFDNSYLDAGPNSINNITQMSTTFDSAGQSNQALVFGSIDLSYFQTNGFYYLGLSNYSYSFALWIYPFVNSGTILQVSSSSGWCVPMIGFNQNGSLTIQTLSTKGIYAVISTSSMLSLNAWTHICMTYSVTHGIRLFVNGTLLNSNSTYTDYSASGEFCTITIGTCLQPNACAVDQTKISSSPFLGKIDELNIFSRELSASEIYNLMT